MLRSTKARPHRNEPQDVCERNKHNKNNNENNKNNNNAQLFSPSKGNTTTLNTHRSVNKNGKRF
jgi:hypothetical protein